MCVRNRKDAAIINETSKLEIRLIVEVVQKSAPKMRGQDALRNICNHE